MLNSSYLEKDFSFDNSQIKDAWTAFALRLGIGSVFIFGGWNKFFKLIDPDTQSALVGSYMGSAGYVNSFFTQYLFTSDGVFTPWMFLTLLSGFELLSGIMIVLGLLVRPLALIYAFLVWTFVMALPVVTTPGVEVSNKTYLAPAILVQIRDITLSGLLFMLYNLGSGLRSLDEKIFGPESIKSIAKWEHLGLLLRLSLAAMLLVAGFFHGMANIKTFDIPSILLIIAGLAMLVEERAARIAGGVLALMMLYYMLSKLSLDKSLIGNLNAIKREFAFLAGGLVLALRGGGDLYTLRSIYLRLYNSSMIALKRMTNGETFQTRSVKP